MELDVPRSESKRMGAREKVVGKRKWSWKQGDGLNCDEGTDEHRDECWKAREWERAEDGARWRKCREEGRRRAGVGVRIKRKVCEKPRAMCFRGRNGLFTAAAISSPSTPELYEPRLGERQSRARLKTGILLPFVREHRILRLFIFVCQPRRQRSPPRRFLSPGPAPLFLSVGQFTLALRPRRTRALRNRLLRLRHRRYPRILLCSTLIFFLRKHALCIPVASYRV